MSLYPDRKRFLMPPPPVLLSCLNVQTFHIVWQPSCASLMQERTYDSVFVTPGHSPQLTYRWAGLIERWHVFLWSHANYRLHYSPVAAAETVLADYSHTLTGSHQGQTLMKKINLMIALIRVHITGGGGSSCMPSGKLILVELKQRAIG